MYEIINKNTINIQAEVSANKRNPSRLKNHLIWDINTLLKEHYNLIDYNIGKK